MLSSCCDFCLRAAPTVAAFDACLTHANTLVDPCQVALPPIPLFENPTCSVGPPFRHPCPVPFASIPLYVRRWSMMVFAARCVAANFIWCPAKSRKYQIRQSIKFTYEIEDPHRNGSALGEMVDGILMKFINSVGY